MSFINKLPTACLDYLLVHLSFTIFFKQHLFGLFACLHVLYYFLTNSLLGLLACLTCPLVFLLPTACFDYLLVHMPFTI